MNVNGIIKSLVATSSTATALCGGRVYPAMMPQKAALPAIVTTVIDGTGNQTKNSTSDAYVFRVQVDCYAATMEAADQLADAVRDVLEYFFGEVTVGSATYTVTSTVLVSTNQTYDDEKEVRRESRDYQMRVLRDVEIIVLYYVVDGSGNHVTDGSGNKVYATT